MKGRLYEAAETLVYDPVVANRHATRASLHTLGFRNVEFPTTLEMLAKMLQARSPDLLLCEVSGGETEVCQFIQSVRQGGKTPNIFLTIIATTWRRDGNVVNQILNSGADDLLARPFSTAMLAERVRAQIERRKGFVVTAEYIGPDRRRDSTRSGAECIEVPNSLKVKTGSGLSSDEGERQILESVRQARETFNLEKMRRNAFQLCVQWRLLEHRRPGGRDFFDILSRIQGLSDEIGRRAVDTPKAFAIEWCESVSESVRGLLAARELAQSKGDEGMMEPGPPMQFLGLAAMTLGQIFAPGDVHSAQLVELDAVVARIQSREARHQSLESALGGTAHPAGDGQAVRLRSYGR